MKKIIYIIGLISIFLILQSCDIRTKNDKYKYVLYVSRDGSKFDEQLIFCDSFKMKSPNYVIFYADGTAIEIKSKYTISPRSNY